MKIKLFLGSGNDSKEAEEILRKSEIDFKVIQKSPSKPIIEERFFPLLHIKEEGKKSRYIHNKDNIIAFISEQKIKISA